MHPTAAVLIEEGAGQAGPPMLTRRGEASRLPGAHLQQSLQCGDHSLAPVAQLGGDDLGLDARDQHLLVAAEIAALAARHLIAGRRVGDQLAEQFGAGVVERLMIARVEGTGGMRRRRPHPAVELHQPVGHVVLAVHPGRMWAGGR